MSPWPEVALQRVVNAVKAEAVEAVEAVEAAKAVEAVKVGVGRGVVVIRF